MDSHEPCIWYPKNKWTHSEDFMTLFADIEHPVNRRRLLNRCDVKCKITQSGRVDRPGRVASVQISFLPWKVDLELPAIAGDIIDWSTVNDRIFVKVRHRVPPDMWGNSYEMCKAAREWVLTGDTRWIHAFDRAWCNVKSLASNSYLPRRIERIEKVLSAVLPSDIARRSAQKAAREELKEFKNWDASASYNTLIALHHSLDSDVYSFPPSSFSSGSIETRSTRCAPLIEKMLKEGSISQEKLYSYSYSFVLENISKGLPTLAVGPTLTRR